MLPVWVTLLVFCRKATCAPCGAGGLPLVKAEPLPEIPPPPPKVQLAPVGPYWSAPPTLGVSKPRLANAEVALIVCDSAELAEPPLLLSPLYVATMLCVPADRPLVLHAAVLLLPLPLKATALQPLMDVPPSVKLTL